MMRGSTTEEQLAALLRSDTADGRHLSIDADVRLLEAARAHGVHALLGDMIGRGAAGSSWSSELRAAFAAETRAQALVEPLRFIELKRVLAALDVSGVQPLLLKGAHLAYSCYPSPHLRPYSDVDLLSRESDRGTVRQVMQTLGYRPAPYVTGDLVTHQFHYERVDVYGLRHEYDVHWKISNPHLFADLLPFEELASEAVPVPALSPAGRGLSPAHALLLACIHRVAHHQNSGRLIWLHDMHLLAAKMDELQWKRFATLAAEKQIRAVCESGVRLAQSRCGTRVPEFVIAELSCHETPASTEPSAAFLRSDRRKVDDLISDLRFLPGWRNKVRLLYQHLFPPAEDLRRMSNASPGPLPVLYARRIFRGARRWFHRFDG